MKLLHHQTENLVLQMNPDNQQRFMKCNDPIFAEINDSTIKSNKLKIKGRSSSSGTDRVEEMKKAKYLCSSEIIDFDSSIVNSKAKELESQSKDTIDITKRCFEFVRDEIYHCVDFDMNPVTNKASEVLIHKTGFCFAKSHLLVALLRANSIPSGFCYQRIKFDEVSSSFCLHGLVAVYLDKYGWY